MTLKRKAVAAEKGREAEAGREAARGPRDVWGGAESSRRPAVDLKCHRRRVAGRQDVTRLRRQMPHSPTGTEGKGRGGCGGDGGAGGPVRDEAQRGNLQRFCSFISSFSI